MYYAPISPYNTELIEELVSTDGKTGYEILLSESDYDKRYRWQFYKVVDSSITFEYLEVRSNDCNGMKTFTHEIEILNDSTLMEPKRSANDFDSYYKFHKLKYKPDSIDFWSKTWKERGH